MEEIKHARDGMTRRTKLKYEAVEEIPPEQVQDSHPVRHFLNYWHALGGGEAVPCRSTFSPAHMPRMLPFLIILEYAERDGKPDFLVRLEGEYVVALSGMNSMGRYLGDFMDRHDFEKRVAEFSRLRRQPAPIIQKVGYPDPGMGVLMGYRGVFPFRLTGDRVGQLFVVVAAAEIEVAPWAPKPVP